MTKKIKILAILSLALVWVGCWQKSVYPFHTERDLAFEAKLVGTWTEEGKEPGKGSTWNFRDNGRQGYYVKIVDSGETNEFDGQLFNLGGLRYLDLFSRRRSLSEIPAHHLLAILVEQEAITVQMLNPDWIRKWLQEQPKTLAHVRTHDPAEPQNTNNFEIVLTATTGELQKFILEHRDQDEFFGEKAKLARNP